MVKLRLPGSGRIGSSSHSGRRSLSRSPSSPAVLVAAGSASASAETPPENRQSRRHAQGPGGGGTPGSGGRGRKTKKKAVAALLFDSPRKAIMKRRGGQHHHSHRRSSLPRQARDATAGGGGGAGGDDASQPPPMTPLVYRNHRMSPEHLAWTPPGAGAAAMPPGTTVPSTIESRQDDEEDGRERESQGSPFDRPPSSFLSSSIHRPRQSAFSRPTAAVKSDGDDDNNVLAWLQHEAPQDIVPKILAFAGPRRMRALSRTCRAWRDIVLDEAVWRTACEDMRKWNDGDPVPSSWLQYYQDNPCVPVDYNTLESAFQVAIRDNDNGMVDPANVNPQVPEQHRSIRILVHPGKYLIREALTVHAVGNNEVTIETLSVPMHPFPLDSFFQSMSDLDFFPSNSTSRGTKLSRKANSLRNRLSCRSIAGAEDSVDNFMTMDPDESGPVAQELAMRAIAFHQANQRGRATIVLKTRRHNEPVLRVRQGTLRVKDIDLVHNCPGTDIWNGNAAVQIQPPFDAEDNPIRAEPPSIKPTAFLTHVDISSISGRGVVNIDGGSATIDSCYIHDCAATGIYVGGPGSVATIERTDVLKNGNGNERNRRGIARGHSGVYLEQGVTTVRDCNISNNSLTGISAISSDNATIAVEETDLMSNGSVQLEMPPTGSASRRRSVTRNNSVSQRGLGRARSGLVREEGSVGRSSIPDLMREPPQSPAVGDDAATPSDLPTPIMAD